jgi:hypothetical protein
MCMSSVDEIYKPPSREWTTAWKAFLHGRTGDLLFPCNYYRGSRSVPRGKWITASNGSIRDGYGQVFYPTGFHVFTTRQDARGFLGGTRGILRVKIRNVVARGSQDGLKVLVAREMLVPRDPKKKKV